MTPRRLSGIGARCRRILGGTSASVLAIGLGVLLAALFLGTDAWAHGGNWYPPRPPTPDSDAPDPRNVPPPPPPPPKPGKPTGPGKPGAPTTPPAGPVGPGGTAKGPATPPPVPDPYGDTPVTPEAPGTRKDDVPLDRPGEGVGVGGGGRRTQPASGIAEESWETWWLLNRWSLLPDREAARRRAAATPTTPTGVGRAGPDVAGGLDRDRELIATEKVIPFLLTAVDPRAGLRDDVVASALLALGRSARDPTAVPILRRWLASPDASPLVRESAALAAGLLRRDRPGDRLGGVELDRVRGHLLDLLDDRQAPARARAFAALGIGLLGDQPFGDAYSRDGRVVTQGLWERLGRDDGSMELTVALLTALGLQPAQGVPEGVRDGLHAVVLGKRVRGRRWNAWERSHALSALGRLGGPGCDGLLLRALDRRGEDVAVRRAALLALGARAEALGPEDLTDALQGAVEAVRGARDPLTSGLAQVTLGRLLGVRLRASAEAPQGAAAGFGLLLQEARGGSMPTRGFSAIALALSCRGVEARTRDLAEYVANAERALLEGLSGGGDPTVRAAFAVALGLAGSVGGVAPLLGIVGDRAAATRLRGHAAVALGQIGRRGPEVARALHLLLAERRSEELRREAALALSLLGEPAAATQLVRELDTGATERLLAQVAVALGRLDDLAAVDPLLRIASDPTRTELTQALAVVSLGLLADPGLRPGFLRLTADANYPARTDALHELFTIL